MIIVNNNEISEVYVGDNGISEAYIGDNKVYPSNVDSFKLQVHYTSDIVTLPCDSNSTLSSSDTSKITDKGTSTPIESVVIGDCVESIANYPFGMFYIKSLTVGKNVSGISHYFIYTVNRLETITFLSPIPPTINSDTFYSLGKNVVIYVPRESLNAYKTAQYWSDVASKIQPM